MANFSDVIAEALKRGAAEEFFGVNKGLMEVSKATKKKPAFVKVAITDEAAMGFMGRKFASFLICFDGDMLNQIAAELDEAEHSHKAEGHQSAEYAQ